jgi:dihydrofolate reductase
MRKLILFNLISVDGFFAGPNGEIDWHNVDEAFSDFAIDQLNSTDGLLFGRVTYQMMASYWPSPDAVKDDPIVAGKMNALPKFVFSRTLDKAEWNNTRLVKENAAEEISKLKNQPGKDLFLFGSADLASSLTPRGLIDEYRILVNPVVLGQGKPLFKNARERLHLKLASTRTFPSGNILLVYQPDVKQPGQSM